MDNQGQDRFGPTGPFDPEEFREILKNALTHSQEANARLIKLFENVVAKRSRWELLDRFSDDDLKEIWSLLKSATQQSYETDRRLHDLLDECQRIIEKRSSSQRYLFDVESRSALLPSASEIGSRWIMARTSSTSPGPSPREFITAELENAGTDGLSAEALSNLFMERFAQRSIKPEGLWATTISRMLKAGEIRQEDREIGRWYSLRTPVK